MWEQKPKKIKEFFNENFHIIESNSIFPIGSYNPSWLEIYTSKTRDFIDTYFLDKFGNKLMDETLLGETDTETRSNIRNRINMYLLLNMHKFDRLWLNYNVEYNPIDNYDRYEEYTDTVGKEFNKQNMGSGTNTELLDKVTNENVQGVAPYDRTAFTDTNTNTTTTTGTGANDKVENVSTIGERENLYETYGTGENGERVNTHSAHLRGNIGTTTTIDMLSQDNNFWQTVLPFYEYLFDNILKECTIGLWEC